MVKPMPTAAPFTAAMSGFGNVCNPLTNVVEDLAGGASFVGRDRLVGVGDPRGHLGDVDAATEHAVRHR